MNSRLDLQHGAGPPVAVAVRRQRDGSFSVTLSDAAVEGTVELTVGGEGLLRLGARNASFYAVQVGRELHLWLDGEVYRFSRAARSAGGPAALLPPGGEVRAPMPGIVVQVSATTGAVVAANELLAVLESMKVQYSVVAPMAGTVAEVLCGVGQMVDLGAALVRLETEAQS